jgi:hypothetical protein
MPLQLSQRFDVYRYSIYRHLRSHTINVKEIFSCIWICFHISLKNILVPGSVKFNYNWLHNLLYVMETVLEYGDPEHLQQNTSVIYS